jgi:ABC-type multidrug transport system ATPase subunit
MNILEADSVLVRFESRVVLNNLYIKVEQEKVVGLLGRNGCGKSTLLKVIFGSLEAEFKALRINGVWMKAGYLNSKVKMLPQIDMIPSDIRIGKAMDLFGVNVSKIKESMAHLLPLLDHRPSQLSGGDRRMIELLMVLYSKSDFILLDEPFTGLSPVMVDRIIEIMQDIKKDKGILITDHLYRMVIKCADRVYTFNNGSIREAIDYELKTLYS